MVQGVWVQAVPTQTEGAWGANMDGSRGMGIRGANMDWGSMGHECRQFKGCGHEGYQCGLRGAYGLNAGVRSRWSKGQGEWCKQCGLRHCMAASVGMPTCVRLSNAMMSVSAACTAWAVSQWQQRARGMHWCGSVWSWDGPWVLNLLSYLHVKHGHLPCKQCEWATWAKTVSNPLHLFNLRHSLTQIFYLTAVRSTGTYRSNVIELKPGNTKMVFWITVLCNITQVSLSPALAFKQPINNDKERHG